MKRIKGFYELRVSVQQRLIKTAFQSQGARQTLFTGTRKPGIPQQNNKRWTCACPSGLGAPAQQPLDWSSDFCWCDWLCLVPGLLLSLSQRCDREPGSRRWPPALHQETMATRHSVTAGDRNRHKHRNCLFCHWGRPAEAWECGGGTRSPSACVLSICPNVTSTVMHLLTVCC